LNDFGIISSYNIRKGRDLMRTTVTIEKNILDELVKETKAKSKATAVKKAIHDYLKGRKIDRIKSMKGKLEFNLTADEIRHYER
jgi:Arc/MetJ family transcription regulator